MQPHDLYAKFEKIFTKQNRIIRDSSYSFFNIRIAHSDAYNNLYLTQVMTTWNNLPKDIANIDSLGTFKKAIEQYTEINAFNC